MSVMQKIIIHFSNFFKAFVVLIQVAKIYFILKGENFKALIDPQLFRVNFKAKTAPLFALSVTAAINYLCFSAV